MTTLTESPRRRWLWVAVALLTAVAVVGASGFRVWLKMAHQTEHFSVTITHKITAIEVSALGGSVNVSSGPAGQVSIGRTLSWVFRKPRIKQTWDGSTMIITAHCPVPNWLSDCGAQLDLRIPAGIAVSAQVGSGSIAASGLAGPLDLLATSGSIDITDSKGSVVAQATSGSIAASGLGATQVNASVTTGSISMAFVAAPRLLALAVRTGSAAVNVPPGTHYRITDIRHAGTITLDAALARKRATGVMKLTVTGGAISVGYPPGAGTSTQSPSPSASARSSRSPGS
jgi:hypothetical protein